VGAYVGASVGAYVGASVAPPCVVVASAAKATITNKKYIFGI
jgi:hypothetical protein